MPRMKLPKFGETTAQAIQDNGSKLTAAIWVLSGLVLILIFATAASRHVVANGA